MPSKRTKFYLDAPLELLPLILEAECQQHGVISLGRFSIAREKGLRYSAIKSLKELEDCLNNPKAHVSDLEPLFESLAIDVQVLMSASRERNLLRDRGASVSHKADRSTDVETINPQQPATEQSGVQHGA